MNTVLLINSIAGLVGVLGPLALTTALKIKSSLELVPDIQVSIVKLTDEAIAADDETMQEVNAWRAAHNLTPLTA